MNSFINNMCFKRLGLSSNTDINQLNSGLIKSNTCECGNSHHMACVVNGKRSCLKCVKLWDEHV